MLHGKKVAVVMPAYNAELTLKRTYREIPFEYVDDVILVDDGSQDRTLTYVDDIADGIIFVSEHAENEDFNIGTGDETSVRELVEMIWEISKREEPLKLKHIAPYEYDVQKRVPDTSKINGLGWQTKTPLEEGLKNTIEWLQK